MAGAPEPFTPLRVIVTRPEREALAWAQGLRALGVTTETLPLIEITRLPDPSALAPAWQAASGHLAVMFVSANAVRFFLAARPAACALPPCRAWSTGPGTQAALLAAGWPEAWIDSPNANAAQFDSEALWAVVQSQVTAALHKAATGTDLAPAQTSVLVVRGADAQGQLAGRDWLVQQLEHAGVHVEQVLAYARHAPQLSAQERALAHQAMTDGSCWLFSSSEAAQHLLAACPGLAVGQARALATHPRIAARLLQSGWGRVDLVAAGLQAQALSIKSLA